MTCLLFSQVAWADAAASVTAFHDTLVAAMKAGTFDSRHEILDEAIEKHFAITTIARISLGRRTWNSLETETRESFEQLLHELVTTTYAARFDNYSGQVFEVLASEAITGDRHRVRCQLVTSEETVSLDYQLQLTDGTWQVYDVAANGVSDLSLKRSNYAALLRDGGLDAVTTDIRQEISENTPGGNSPGD